LIVRNYQGRVHTFRNPGVGQYQMLIDPAEKETGEVPAEPVPVPVLVVKREDRAFVRS
jgi:hypothetical protein